MALRLRNKRKLHVPESLIQQAVRDYLQLRGWFVLRTNTVRGKLEGGGWIKQGEKGQPDLLAIKPELNPPMIGDAGRKQSLVLWIETKAEGGKLSPAQVLYQDYLRKLGFQCITVSDTDPAGSFGQIVRMA